MNNFELQLELARYLLISMPFFVLYFLRKGYKEIKVRKEKVAVTGFTILNIVSAVVLSVTLEKIE